MIWIIDIPNNQTQLKTYAIQTKTHHDQTMVRSTNFCKKNQPM